MLSAFMSSRDSGGRTADQKYGSFADFFLRFYNCNQAGKPIHQGFPSSNRDVKPVCKAGELLLWSHTSNTIFYELVV